VRRVIECKVCGSGQFLQISRSKMLAENGERVTEIEEEYHCTLCDSEGQLTIWNEDGLKRSSIVGEIEETDEEPRVSP